MDNAERLRLAGVLLLAETEVFCDRAKETLDDLEAWGKEPVLEADWLSGLVPEDPYYFTAGKLVGPMPELPELPRQERGRSPEQEPPVNASVDVSEVLGLAHAEDPQAWQNAIVMAMDAQPQPVGFWRLVEVTGLSPGELLLGLLMGGWRLSQDSFYGEILCSSQK
ncbi:MAG: hypothetical protein ACR2FS_04670 [Phormidesmis sp.]